MRILSKLFLAMFLLPALSFAQNNYKPGYVVTLKGDTSKGFVDYKEWENNPSAINFKPASDAKVQQLTPGDIQYFEISQLESYKSYNGPISTDQVNVNYLTTGRDTTFRTAAVFLKVEADGKYLTLYSYSDDLKRRYFVAEKSDGRPQELIYRLYMNPNRDIDTKTIIENKYKGQLIYLASKYNSDSNDFRSVVDGSNYDQDLVNVVNKINHKTQQPRSHKNSGTSLYVGISSGPTGINPPNPNYSNFDRKVTPINSYLPRIAFGLNAYTNPDVGKLVFRGEIAIAANTFKTEFYEYMYTGTRSYFKFNQYTVSLNPQVLYNVYNTASLKFYLDAGLSLNYSKYDDTKFYNGQYNTTSAGSIKPASDWVSFSLSAGTTLNNKVSIFVIYTPPVSISEDDYKFYSAQVGVNYIFGHRK